LIIIHETKSLLLPNKLMTNQDCNTSSSRLRLRVVARNDIRGAINPKSQMKILRTILKLVGQTFLSVIDDEIASVRQDTTDNKMCILFYIRLSKK